MADKKSKPGKQQSKSPSKSPVKFDAAAATAAAMIGNRIAGATGASTESSAFRHMKESLAKPHLQSLGNMLDTSAPSAQKKSGVPFGDKTIGHSQTNASDASRKNVPRRTGGG